jgi:hypothetical protein
MAYAHGHGAKTIRWKTKEDIGDLITIPETKETATISCKSMAPELSGK